MVIVHPVDPYYFFRTSSMVSRHLAEAFAKDSKPKWFYETMLMALHIYKDGFSKTAFDALQQCQK
jgi:hypothetical protein